MRKKKRSTKAKLSLLPHMIEHLFIRFKMPYMNSSRISARLLSLHLHTQRFETTKHTLSGLRIDGGVSFLGGMPGEVLAFKGGGIPLCLEDLSEHWPRLSSEPGWKLVSRHFPPQRDASTRGLKSSPWGG
jgi:hypothetical protein